MFDSIIRSDTILCLMQGETSQSITKYGLHNVHMECHIKFSLVVLALSQVKYVSLRFHMIFKQVPLNDNKVIESRQMIHENSMLANLTYDLN